MTVTIRPLAEDDLDSIFEWQRDPAAVHMAAFTHPDPNDRAAFDAHQRRILHDPSIRSRVVEEDGVLVGTIAAFTMEGDREVTYWLDPTTWGRGIATAALRLLLAEEDTRPLFARVAEGNPGSLRVLEKVGFEVIGTEVSHAAGRGCDVRESILRLSSRAAG